MSMITRRAALGAVATIPAMGAATAAPTAPGLTSPIDRFHAAVAELKTAAEALDPNIYQWMVDTNGDKQCGLRVAAFRTTTKYEGDGWYQSQYEWGEVKQALVRRAPEHDKKGERWFRITPYPATSNRGTVLMAEHDFRINYGPRIN